MLTKGTAGVPRDGMIASDDQQPVEKKKKKRKSKGKKKKNRNMPRAEDDENDTVIDQDAMRSLYEP